jgi:hypothetical protein
MEKEIIVSSFKSSIILSARNILKLAAHQVKSKKSGVAVMLVRFTKLFSQNLLFSSGTENI